MNIRNIEHIGIDTADTEETVKFYSEVLGLELLGEKDLGGDCASYMKINEDSVLELFRPQKTAGCEKNTGVRHIAFAVDDLYVPLGHLILLALAFIQHVQRVHLFFHGRLFEQLSLQI